MNVLVTGAAGFIGSHLVDRLLAEGHSVIGVDNLSTGQSGNLAHLADEPRFILHQADVTHPLELPTGTPPPQAICHLASPASPVDFGRLAVPIMRVNAEATRLLLEMADRHSARFFFSSTSEVYGDARVHPQPEDYVGHVNPVGPRAVYDESKRYAEALITAYRTHCGVQTRIVRIFNTYGPRMRPDDGRVIPSFVCAALAGEPLVIHGDGSRTRSFCYVSDTVEGIHRLLMSDQPGPINIGNPDEVDMLTVAREIIELTESTSKLVHVPAPVDDPQRRCPDISRARERLGWQPTVSRREGLTRTVQYFRNLNLRQGSRS
ncbi:MAG: UDP-glucose 4-epimerase [Phycisphaerae bacterium]|nr:UDP-glucose 4-epimerase [Phycisphaerae bacterium]